MKIIREERKPSQGIKKYRDEEMKNRMEETAWWIGKKCAS